MRRKRERGTDHLPAAPDGVDVAARINLDARSPSRPEGGRGPILMLANGKQTPLMAGVDTRIKDRAAVDLVFCFDTTGSMTDKIDGCVRATADLVHACSELDLDLRSTVVPFGDLRVPGDRIVANLPFVTTRREAEAQLRTMPRFSGGGNDGESSIEAMRAALNRAFRPSAVKVIVLITDEPAHIAAEATPEQVLDAMTQRNVVCFVASPNLQYYRRWARETGGEWFLIGPSMDMSAVVRMLRSLVCRVATVARAVHEVGDGSVKRYLELTSGSARPAGERR